GNWISGYRSFLIRTQYTGCLSLDQQYRVEFYIDGRSVNPGYAPPVAGERFQAAAFREPGAAMCFPETWQRLQVDPGMLQGGYHAPDDRRGVMVHAFFDGRPPPPKGPPVRSETIRVAVNRTLRTLRMPPLNETSVAKPNAPCGGYFDEHWLQRHIELGLPSVTVLAKAWRTPDGLDVVGVVWQRPGKGDQLSCRVLTSITSVDRDVPVVKPMLASSKPK
ncbi:MAG: hypothetical protein QOD51_1263, partial [Candidatus Eremiobacteraeota bacterium]|nr:hypothetical protein [Candidatus Eremiobacteraeota bacterium]